LEGEKEWCILGGPLYKIEAEWCILGGKVEAEWCMFWEEKIEAQWCIFKGENRGTVVDSERRK
jgi:hypothetical protein